MLKDDKWLSASFADGAWWVLPLSEPSTPRTKFSIDSEDREVDSVRVTAIYPNKEKRVCAMKFSDGTVVVMRLSKGDKWDLRTAIAYAIAQKSLGSKTAFARYADSLIEAAERKKK